MMSRTTKLVITLILCACAALAIIFSDVIWSVILLGVIFSKGLILQIPFDFEEVFLQRRHCFLIDHCMEARVS